MRGVAAEAAGPGRPNVRRILAAMLAVAVVSVAGDLRPAGASAGIAGEPPQRQSGTAGAEDPVLRDFQQRLKSYLDLRESLSKKLAPLKSTDDTAVLVSRQESLAAALRENRKSAKPGDLLTPAITERLRKAIAADFKARTKEDRRAVYAESPRGLRLVVNRTFPADAALPTVPPLLLQAMPSLPDNLQYRFAGRSLILLDGDTQIIADYATNVLPAE